MLEETAQADGILSALTGSKPAKKKKKAKKAKKATAKKPAAKKAKKAAKKKPAAKKKAAKKPAKKKAAKKVAKKAAKKPAKKKAAKKTAKKAAKKPAKRKAAKKTAKKAVKKAAKKPAKRKAAKKSKKSVKKPKDGAAVNLKVFTTTASSKAGQSATTFKKGIETLGNSLVSFAQDQLQESVQTARQLANCRSLEDVATVQTKFVKQSFERLVKQANKMAQTTAGLAKGAAEPLSNQMENWFNKYRAA